MHPVGLHPATRSRFVERAARGQAALEGYRDRPPEPRPIGSDAGRPRHPGGRTVGALVRAPFSPKHRALLSIADMQRASSEVCFGPQADSCIAANIIEEGAGMAP